MVDVVAFDTLWTECSNTGHGRAEVCIRLTVVFLTGLLDLFGSHFRVAEIGELTMFHT
mgnify:CR=1 FL=1